MWMIWGLAAALYAAFRAWYDNWGGKVSRAKIDAFLAEARRSGADQHNDMAIVERFLAEDDGREFFMLNLVKVHPGDVPDPDTGAPVKGRDLLARYTNPFMRRLFQRGGHPALAARPIGGYVDAWDAAPDPGWTLVGYMRYRSRRDMMKLAGAPEFRDIHRFKMAATATTYSFPTRPMIMTLMGPRLWVLLVIALAAALAQIAVMTLKATG